MTNKLYTKISTKIIGSSLWALPAPYIKVWLTMLSMSDLDGIVTDSIIGIQHMSRESMETCRAAIEVFTSPDPDSTTPDYEGRRLVKLTGGGWQFVNSDKYQELGWSEDKKKFERERKARYRQNQKAKENTPPPPMPANATTVASKEAKPKTVRVSQPVNEAFEDFWTVYPKKEGKKKAQERFEEQGCAAIIGDVLAGIERQMQEGRCLAREYQFIPHPSTWLNQRVWESDKPSAFPPKPAAPAGPPPVFKCPLCRKQWTLDSGGPGRDDFETESQYLSSSAMFRDWRTERLIFEGKLPPRKPHANLDPQAELSRILGMSMEEAGPGHTEARVTT